MHTLSHIFLIIAIICGPIFVFIMCKYLPRHIKGRQRMEELYKQWQEAEKREDAVADIFQRLNDMGFTKQFRLTY